ncbi:ASKHA domain-containing protein [Candidatus Pseudothioglobus singularis]|nr:ASKHA domain-containing protein [Candidatus Pseudothioglobus singularis]
MDDNYQVCFTPSGRQFKGEFGDTLLQVAQDAGVAIRSLCGGYGQCHQCWIEVSEGEHSKFGVKCDSENVSAVTRLEKQLIQDNPTYKGKRLACQSCIQGDLVIDVPEDSQEHKAYISKKNAAQTYSISSSISLIDCTLDEATLDENPSASENLIAQLTKQGIKANIDFNLLRDLQPLIHETKGKLTVAVRDSSQIVAAYPKDTHQILGAAIDIGSTTLALYVYDLKNGKLVYESSAMNPQIRFGEDLMSRVSYVMMNKGGDEKLTAAVRGKITEMLHEACENLEAEWDKLLEVVLVGNPIMHHIFFGISPVELGQAPFTLSIRSWLDVDAKDLGFDLYPKTRLSFLPLIAGHVGADTAAAYLSQMDIMHNKTTLLVDIGTNAEIMLSKEGKVYATSSPTGPAFEGAEISSGVRATYGAIERVRIDKDSFKVRFKVIGCDAWSDEPDYELVQMKAVGICGSGIIEAIVAFAEAGIIDQSGLFVESIAPELFSKKGNTTRFLLVDQGDKSIYIEQVDIRSIQLAKAALSAGVSILMDYLDCDHFDKILLAGAFGAHLDARYVALLDIIPTSTAEKIESVGNAAGIGASAALLDVNKKLAIIEAVDKVVKIETATEPRFQEFFVDAMKFSVSPVKQQQTKKVRRRKRAS